MDRWWSEQRGYFIQSNKLERPKHIYLRPTSSDSSSNNKYELYEGQYPLQQQSMRSLIPLQRAVEQFEKCFRYESMIGEQHVHSYHTSFPNRYSSQNDFSQTIQPTMQYALSYSESVTTNPEMSLSSESSIITTNKKQQKQKAVKSRAAKTSSITKIRRSSLRYENPKPSLDTFIRYPVLFQNHMNGADSQAFMNSFRDKCEEGFVALGYYVDSEGKVMHQRALRSNIGWVQYKRYLEDLFNFIPDAVFMTCETTFIRNDHEIIVCSEFLYTGTYMALQPNNEEFSKPIESLSQLQSVRKYDIINSGTSTIPQTNNQFLSVDSTIDYHTIFSAEGEVEGDYVNNNFTEDESYLSQIPLPPSVTDLSIITSLNTIEGNGIHSKDDGTLHNPHEWVPATSSNEESGQYILGQFVPSNSKQLRRTENTPFSSAKSAEVSIQGKFRFHINSESYLIRRIEFAYQQDSMLESST